MNRKIILSFFSTVSFIAAVYFFLQFGFSGSSHDLRAAEILYPSAQDEVLQELEATPNEDFVLLEELEATPEDKITAEELNQINQLYDDYPCVALFSSCFCTPPEDQVQCVETLKLTY